jgi:cell division inhibitor SepF
VGTFKDMFKKFLGFDDEFEDEEEGETSETIDEDKLNEHKSYYGGNISSNETNKKDYKTNSNILSKMQDLHDDYDMKPKEIIVFPKTFAEAIGVVDKIALGNIVVVNMEDVEVDTCKRIADFVLGAIYVLDGDVEKISKKVFRFWIDK